MIGKLRSTLVNIALLALHKSPWSKLIPEDNLLARKNNNLSGLGNVKTQKRSMTKITSTSMLVIAILSSFRLKHFSKRQDNYLSVYILTNLPLNLEKISQKFKVE